MILFIIATHIQELILIIIRTLFIRRNELIKDYSTLYYLCQFNDTEIAPNARIIILK